MKKFACILKSVRNEKYTYGYIYVLDCICWMVDVDVGYMYMCLIAYVHMYPVVDM